MVSAVASMAVGQAARITVTPRAISSCTKGRSAAQTASGPSISLTRPTAYTRQLPSVLFSGTAPRLAPTTSMLTGTVPAESTLKHSTTGAGSSQPVRKKAMATNVAISGGEMALLMFMPFVLPFISATPSV